MNIYIVSCIMGASAVLIEGNRHDVPESSSTDSIHSQDASSDDFYESFGKRLAEILPGSGSKLVCACENSQTLNATSVEDAQDATITCSCSEREKPTIELVDAQHIDYVETTNSSYVNNKPATFFVLVNDTICDYVSGYGWNLSNSTQSHPRIFVCDKRQQQKQMCEFDYDVSKEAGINKGYSCNQEGKRNIIKEVLNSHIKSSKNDRKKYVGQAHRRGYNAKSNHPAPIIRSSSKRAVVEPCGSFCSQRSNIGASSEYRNSVDGGFQTPLRNHHLKAKKTDAANQGQSSLTSDHSQYFYLNKGINAYQRFKREMHIMMARYRHEESTGPRKTKPKGTTRPPKPKESMMTTTPHTFLNVSFTGSWDRDSSKTTVKPKRVKKPLKITDQDMDFVHGKSKKDSKKGTTKGKSTKSKSDSSFPGGWPSSNF